MAMTEAEKQALQEKKVKEANGMLQTILDFLNEEQFHFEQSEDYEVHFTVKGDDLPMEIYLSVDVDREVIRLFSILPFKVDPDNYGLMAEGIVAINDHLVNGNFDLNKDHMMMSFRMAQTYRDSLLSKSAVAYVLYTSLNTMDDYNDKLFMLNKGKATLEELMAD